MFKKRRPNVGLWQNNLDIIFMYPRAVYSQNILQAIQL